jgi:Iron-dependent Transcriptional regulator
VSQPTAPLSSSSEVLNAGPEKEAGRVMNDGDHARPFLHVSYAGDEGTTSEAIAKSLQTNPVVVRKILKLLEREGLVALCQGRHGGVGLRRPASRITLGQIYRRLKARPAFLPCAAKCMKDARWPAR